MLRLGWTKKRGREKRDDATRWFDSKGPPCARCSAAHDFAVDLAKRWTQTDGSCKDPPEMDAEPWWWDSFWAATAQDFPTRIQAALKDMSDLPTCLHALGSGPFLRDKASYYLMSSPHPGDLPSPKFL